MMKPDSEKLLDRIRLMGGVEVTYSIKAYEVDGEVKRINTTYKTELTDTPFGGLLDLATSLIGAESARKPEGCEAKKMPVIFQFRSMQIDDDYAFLRCCVYQEVLLPVQTEAGNIEAFIDVVDEL